MTTGKILPSIFRSSVLSITFSSGVNPITRTASMWDIAAFPMPKSSSEITCGLLFSILAKSGCLQGGIKW